MGFSSGEDYGDEGISFVEDDDDGGMYYPSEMAQYIEEEAIFYSGDWDSGSDVEDEAEVGEVREEGAKEGVEDDVVEEGRLLSLILVERRSSSRGHRQYLLP